MGVANVPAASAAGLQPKYQKFTSSGTFTLPTGYGVSKPLLVNIQVIGGGGGGSTVVANNNTVVYWAPYFGEQINGVTVPGNGGVPGGSGGLAQTQMYLTGNLTITVGAAGTRDTTTHTFSSSYGPYNTGNNSFGNFGSGQAGTGGTSIAGSVEATGGAGATYSYDAYVDGRNGNRTLNGFTGSVGAGGTPAGTAGAATPLLGTIAGGSYTNTPVRGSFGIGGKLSDAGTTTGVEGTGGGAKSIAASGAVILTWWE